MALIKKPKTPKSSPASAKKRTKTTQKRNDEIVREQVVQEEIRLEDIKHLHICTMCGKIAKTDKELSRFFYNSKDITHQKTGRVHICKDCCREYCFNAEGSYSKDKIKKLLREVLNRPFISRLFEEEDGTEFEFGKYMRMLSLPQYKDLSWEDSQISEADSPSEEFIINEYEAEWGKGFSKSDYLFLEEEYKNLENNYNCETYAQKMIFQELAQLRLQIRRKRYNALGADVRAELKAFQDLLQSSGIKPIQDNTGTEQASWGTLVKKIENEEPIPEALPEWKDVDGIMKYLTVWFFGHIARMMGIANDNADLYNEEIKKYTIEKPEYESEFEIDEDGEVQ